MRQGETLIYGKVKSQLLRKSLGTAVTNPRICQMFWEGSSTPPTIRQELGSPLAEISENPPFRSLIPKRDHVSV
jgi:hypothetical protein